MNSMNLHVLFSFAAGNPNRDDAGSPKAVNYGGSTRSRISSQAMTRPKRLRFEAETTGERTQRSALVGTEIARQAEAILTKQGTAVDEKLRARLLKSATKSALSLVMDPKKAAKKAEALVSIPVEKNANSGEDPDQNKRTEEAEAGDTLVWLAESEIHEAALKLANKYDTSIEPEEFVHAQRTQSLSIAAFGRMFAQRPELQNEAAVQRSHAFTTHENEVEVDYFTAVDDLRDSDRGAGHINMAMLTGGVYYWHCNVDARQLFATWSGATEEGARDRIVALFCALFEALPTGKQNTTGYQGLPSLVLAVPARSAVSLQTAFETPVLGGGSGYLLPSTKALLEEHMVVRQAKPSHFGPAAVAVAATAVAEALDKFQSDDAAITTMNLDELAAWCADQVLTECPADTIQAT
ncbi:MAG: type I-E CRISPR-associated protein Cas7/Cse4/CasC [Acidimicrobiales bacterium]